MRVIYVQPEVEDHWGWTYNKFWGWHGQYQEMPFFIYDDERGMRSLLELPKSWLAL